MAEDRKYFVFHTGLDYRRGQSQGLVFEDGVLRPDSDKPGLFLSRLLDSREKGMEWHRLRLDLPDEEESYWKLRLYCSDSLMLETDGNAADLKELLESREISIQEKLQWMEPCCVKSIQGIRDIPLFDVRGRYLWFCLETAGRGEKPPEGIREIRIDFPKRTLLRYLPEVYQKERKSREFLERYLGIFQSLYEDMTEKAEQAAMLFDPDSADPEFLAWMSGWIALEDTPTWNEEQLRYLMKHAMQLYRIRGTVGYLKAMLRLYTGCEAFVVENYQISRFRNNMGQTKRLKEMYGDSAGSVTVLVNTGTLTDRKQYHTLVQIAEHAAPAHIRCRIVLLQQYIFLDQYSYLGVNSRLGQYRPLQLDGLSAMHFARLEKRI